MKKHLVFLGALALATGAWAGGGSSNPDCDVCKQDIKLQAATIQTVDMFGSSANAWANGANSTAGNNMSSNTYGVLINANSTQTTNLKMSHVSATANGADSVAQNNLASNIGAVGVGATQIQTVKAHGSFIKAYANGANSRAVQNFATNNACEECW